MVVRAPAGGAGLLARFDLNPDGKRFAVLRAAEDETEVRRDKVVFITNYFDELRRLAAGGEALTSRDPCPRASGSG